jgi:hypothetical protein
LRRPRTPQPRSCRPSRPATGPRCSPCSATRASGSRRATPSPIARRASHFVAAYETKHAIQRDGDKATLVVGSDDYPFAFPIVKSGEKWRFDTAAGKDELLARRIGQNELDVIKVLQAIVDAQNEYASEDRNGDGVLAYAQKFASSPGKHDGLYWPAKAGEPPSPAGALVAQRRGAGLREGPGPTPFHGYYYRMLKGQGKNATSGAFDYVVRGRAIGGFAVVAYPARYGNSGIMTFIVNHDGKIYQADLGPKPRKRRARCSGSIQARTGRLWRRAIAAASAARSVRFGKRQGDTSCKSLQLHRFRRRGRLLPRPSPRRTGTAVVGKGPGMAGAAQTVKVTATITAIDAKTRDITLKGPQGNEVTVTAAPTSRTSRR